MLFSNCFSNRHHFVSFSGGSRKRLSVLSGVPQGSVLSRLLLILIFINNLPDANSHYFIYLFADDSKLVKLIRSVTDASLLQKTSTTLMNGAIAGTCLLILKNALICAFQHHAHDSLINTTLTVHQLTVQTRVKTWV